MAPLGRCWIPVGMAPAVELELEAEAVLAAVAVPVPEEELAALVVVVLPAVLVPHSSEMLVVQFSWPVASPAFALMQLAKAVSQMC